MIRQFSLITVAILLLAVFAQPVLADITSSGDIDPTNPATWTSSTGAYVGKTSQGSVNVDSGSNLLSNYGYIGYEYGSVGEVTVSDAGSTWDIDGPPMSANEEIFIGKSGDGTLNIINGGTVNNYDGYIGYESGSTGKVIVSGTGSTWTNDRELRIGNYGSGTLDITGGGKVNNFFHGGIGIYSGSMGVVTVDGAGSMWWASGNHQSFYIGNHGSGTLNITGGGAVSSDGSFIGCNPGSAGKVTVNGTGSTWNAKDLYVGGGYSGGGSGTLNITNGGTVNSGWCWIESESGSTSEVIVDGVGSTWTNDLLNIGSEGEGIYKLNITGGGAVSSGNSHIGGGHGSTSEVTVDGVGSTWTNSLLNIGSEGESICKLNITGGGTVSSSSGHIAPHSWTGVVTVDGTGSTWTNSVDLFVGGDGIMDGGIGELNITNGGLVSVAETLNIDYDLDGDSFIYMATGGMLALYGDADDSLDDFLNIIDGTDAICYWDDSASNWADITGATYGVDYTLSYLTEGDLDGYTILTVTAIPEPTTILLLGLGGLMLRRKKK